MTEPSTQSETTGEKETIVVVGKESVGKSALVAGLTGTTPTTGNFRGTTVDVERYESPERVFVDTPGILLDADTETTRTAIEAVEGSETVLLVIRATNIDSDLEDLLPLVQGKVGAVAVTFWDKVENQADARAQLDALAGEVGVPVVPVDARTVTPAVTDGGDAVPNETGYNRLHRAIADADRFPGQAPQGTGISLEPPTTILEHTLLGPVLSIALLLLPAAVAVHFANAAAAALSPRVGTVLEPAVQWASGLPGPLAAVVGGDYGLLSMGPFLFVWAGPTMLIFAMILGVYKNTGIVTRMTVSLHPIMRQIGLSGRDLIRVVMGFGCNVPAVVNTRSCSDCTRCSTISAISFGSACSYQFPATLAVFAAVGMGWLVGPYLAVLAVTTFIYVGVIAPAEARQSTTVVDRRTFLSWPDPKAVAREAWSAIREFFVKALPVFVVITFVAAALDRLGVIDALGSVLGPAMSLFNLPADTALTVVLASIRKDGIALLTADGASTAATLSPVQVLVVVYLAGVLLPCLVTAFTVAREVSARWALKMMARQAAAAVTFAAVIAWSGALLFG